MQSGPNRSEIIVKSPYIDRIKSSIQKDRLNDLNQKYIEQELFYLECNHDAAKYVLSLLDSKKKYKNTNNSSVIYALNISDDKPTKPIRKELGSLPDVDYDISNRDAVKKYLVDKYGVNHVALIGTYSSLATRGAIKDAIRQYDRSCTPEQANIVCKMFDRVEKSENEKELAYFERALSEEPSIADWFKERPTIKEIVLKMLNVNKNAGIHAGGIIITKADIREVCPTKFDKDEGLYVTQLTMKDVEYIGLIKYDFLKVDVLKVLGNTLKLALKDNDKVEKLKNLKIPLKPLPGRIKFDGIALSQIPLNDPDVHEALRKDASGTFQFGTGLGMQVLGMINRLDSIEVESAITAAARPGPMKAGVIEKFARRINGEEEVQYELPELEPILKNTYGLMIYQEQIMDILTKIAGISPHEGYTIIKAISKKDEAKISSFKDKFVSNSVKRKHPIAKVTKLWEDIKAFSEYGFNKSHAMAYAITGYISAWMKYHLTEEFVSNHLSNIKKEKFEEIFPLWRKYLLHPSMQNCSMEYSVVGNGKVAMPITEIKGVSNAIAPILAEGASYLSFTDFLSKMESKRVSKSVIKSLVLAGAFDYLNHLKLDIFAHRFTLIEEMICFNHNIEPRTPEERKEGVTLASRKKKPSKALLKDQEDFNELRQMGRIKLIHKEVELLGFSTFNYYEYLGSVGVNKVKAQFSDKVKYLPLKRVTGDLVGESIVILGAVHEVKVFKIKKPGKYFGKEMAKITLVEDDKKIMVNVFCDTYEKDKNGIIKGLKTMQPLICLGKVTYWEERKEISIDLKEAVTI